VTWADNLADINAACIDTAAFGEAVILPTGAAFAIVDLAGLPVELREQGTRTQGGLDIGQQVNPVIHLREEDAEALREQDPVTVRGLGYLVVRLTPDGAGMTLVELMRPGQETAPQPTWNQWR
jgi:hypothetical protein